MEEAIPDRSWALFRAYPVGSAPSPSALDGQRVIVQLREGADAETGDQYTLKRWRVTKHTDEGGVLTATRKRADLAQQTGAVIWLRVSGAVPSAFRRCALWPL
jgi:hypothetical protein